MSAHLVTKRDRAALIGFDLHQMEGDVSVELLEEWDPVTNQDRQDRITNFISQTKTEAFGRDNTASNKPDASKRRPQAPIDKLSKVA